MHGMARAAARACCGGACWLALTHSAVAGGILDPLTKTPDRAAAAANQRQTPATATQPEPQPVRRVRWDILARSVESRVIEYAQFGSGKTHVLVIGSLVGNEPEGVSVADSLAEHLERFPRRLDEVTVTIVRNPNPDGHQRGTAENARGVRIDKNFRTLGWRKVASGTRFVSGPQPESEPETRALVELLADARPQRIVLLGTSSGRNTVQFTGDCETLARQVVAEGDFRMAPLDQTAEWGSLLAFAGLEGNIPTLRLAFVPQEKSDALFSGPKRAIMTAIGCGTTFEQRPAAADRAAPEPNPVAQPASMTTTSPPETPLFEPPPLPAGTLKFESISSGLPVVPVTPPNMAPSVAPTAIPAPPLAVIEQPPVKDKAAGALAESIRPLPSLDFARPAVRPGSRQISLPQPPIPVYPDTGLK